MFLELHSFQTTPTHSGHYKIIFKNPPKKQPYDIKNFVKKISFVEKKKKNSNFIQKILINLKRKKEFLRCKDLKITNLKEKISKKQTVNEIRNKDTRHRDRDFSFRRRIGQTTPYKVE